MRARALSPKDVSSRDKKARGWRTEPQILGPDNDAKHGILLREQALNPFRKCLVMWIATRVYGSTQLPGEVYGSQRTAGRQLFIPTVWVSILPFYLVGSRDQTHIIRLDSKCIYLLSCPAGSLTGSADWADTCFDPRAILYWWEFKMACN